MVKEDAPVQGVTKTYRGFRLIVNEIEFALGCQLESDWEQWLRVLFLILQMRRLDLDCSLVNLFVFEHFRQEQLLIHSNALAQEE